MNIKFSPPDISQQEIEEVIDALQSGWITTGPKTKKFEQMIADYCGVSKAVCLNSQTACQELTLRILGIGPGDEVIVPAYTYTASCSVIYHVGAIPVMIDCSENSYEMNYKQLESAITEKTKVIIPVDLGGIPCDYDTIFEIVNRKKNLFKPSNDIQKAFGRIIICADTAHSFGASYKGKPIGSIADFSSFSFHAVKNLTTAEGGAVTWNDIHGIDSKDIYDKFMLMSLHGQNKDALSKNKLGAWEYDIIEPWYKCNMTDIMAALGLAQLSRYNSLLSRRKEIIKMYDEGFCDLSVQYAVHFSDKYNSSGHLYLLRLNNKDVSYRNDFIVKMAEKGVACNVHYKPLPLFKAYSTRGYNINDYPNAYNMYQNEVTLPLHTKLTNDEVKYVIKCVREILGK